MPPKKRILRNNPVQSSEEDDNASESDAEVNTTPKPRRSAKKGKNPTTRGKRKSISFSRNNIEIEPVRWEHHDLEYDENEDLLNIVIPPKPIDFETDKQEYRLMIQKIIVEDFKSYKGTHTIGPFHKNLTMILGPNGSGKSNVIDSLLFVFGFRSNKIRSKKLSSLIHTAAGSEKCKSCTVEIYFHVIKDVCDDKYVVKPGSRFSIGRTAFLDNSSKYTIDGRNANYKDVENLLRTSGIDLVHNRFLILQGEVEAIAMMKPRATNPGEEGMLEYIEDIVGSNRFVPFIRKLDYRVAKLEVETSQQSMKSREAERNKKELEPDVKNAQRFLNAQNESAILKSKLFQCDRWRLNNEKKPLEAEIKEKENELRDLEKRKKQLMTEIREIEATEKENSSDQDKIHDEIEAYLQEIRDAEAAEVRRKANLKKCNNELVRLHKELDTKKKQRCEIEAIPDNARKRIEILSEESKELLEQEEHELKTATDNLLKFERKAKEERMRKEAFEEEYSRKNAILNEARTKVTVGEDELEDLKQISIRDQKKLDELRSTIYEAQLKYDSEKKEFAQLKRDLPPEERQLRDAQVMLPHLKKSEVELRTKACELKDKYEDETSGYQTLLKGSKVHNALLKAKATGRLPGLLGRLGDLGAIDELYDAAISTTCPQLDWYVVETANDGQQAIDYLIECSLPRCSFMCIDQSINADAGMNKDRKQFPAPRLFDLLRISEKRIRKIFYQCVGDMLVAPTLLEAQKIDREFKGKYRIVTYEGNTIERTGAVSGGGRPITGRIGRDIRAPPSEQMQEEFRRTRAEYDQTVIEHQEIYTQMQRLEVQLTHLTKKVHGMTEARKKFEVSLPAQAQVIAALKRAIQEQEKEAGKIKVNPKEIENKEAKLVKLRKERSDAEEAANATKLKVDRSTEKIDLMFNELVQKFKDRAATSRERYNNVEQELAKERASIVNSKHNLITIQKEIENQDTMIMKKRIECDALSSAEADGKEVFNLHDLVRNRRKKLSLLRETASELRRKRQELDEEEREQTKKVTDMKDVLSTLNQTLDDIELHLENIERQMTSLKLRKVPNFRKYQQIRTKEKIGWLHNEENEEGEEDVEGENDEENDDYEEEEEEEEENANEGEEDEEEENRNKSIRKSMDLYDSDTDSESDEIPVLTDEEIEGLSRAEKDQMKLNLKTLDNFMENNRRNTDERIFKEYVFKAELYIKELRKLEKVSEQESVHRKKLVELKESRLNEFSEALTFLGATTQALYQMITNGGNASLKFVEEGKSADPFDAGVKFSVRPAKKSWKLIENLSGGEKTLASLCFVFAMHHYRSTPLYIMDEIDAALDSQNVRLIANYIKGSERTRNAQFIIISLRNQMFEVGNRLIGIYKTNDCTHHVVVSPFESKKECNNIGAALKSKMKELNRRERAIENGQDDATANALSAEMNQVSIHNEHRVMMSKRKTLVVPKLTDLEPLSMNDVGIMNGKRFENVPSTSRGNKHDVNPFDFEDDDAPVPKRRRRTVCDDDDDDDDNEDEDEDEDDEDEDEEGEDDNDEAETVQHLPSTSKFSKDVGSRRATRSSCR